MELNAKLMKGHYMEGRYEELRDNKTQSPHVFRISLPVLTDYCYWAFSRKGDELYLQVRKSKKRKPMAEVNLGQESSFYELCKISSNESLRLNKTLFKEVIRKKVRDFSSQLFSKRVDTCCSYSSRYVTKVHTDYYEINIHENEEGDKARAKLADLVHTVQRTRELSDKELDDLHIKVINHNDGNFTYSIEGNSYETSMYRNQHESSRLNYFTDKELVELDSPANARIEQALEVAGLIEHPTLF